MEILNNIFIVLVYVPTILMFMYLIISRDTKKRLGRPLIIWSLIALWIFYGGYMNYSNYNQGIFPHQDPEMYRDIARMCKKFIIVSCVFCVTGIIRCVVEKKYKRKMEQGEVYEKKIEDRGIYFFGKRFAKLIPIYVLIISCMVLSRITCILNISYIHIMQEFNMEYVGFMPSIYLEYGIIEILLLLCRKRSLHIIAVIISYLKVVLPWYSIVTSNYNRTFRMEYFPDYVSGLNALSQESLMFGAIPDYVFTAEIIPEYVICNPIPYIITVLAVITFLLISISVFKEMKR